MNYTKILTVINSCKLPGQLETAINYADRAYTTKTLSKDGYMSLLGYAQIKLKLMRMEDETARTKNGSKPISEQNG